MASSRPHFLSFASCLLLTTTVGFTLASCNKPPTRSFTVRVDKDSSDLEGAQDEVDNSDPGNPSDPSDPESNGETEGDPENNDDPVSPIPPKGEQPIEMETPKDPVTPDPKDPGPVTPDPLEPKPNEPKPLVECANKLSVGRIHQWHATSEGVMIPSSGLIVVKEGTKNVAKVEFVGNDWHVVPVWLKNAYEAEVDLSKSKNFTITYSATAELYVQLRPAFAWSGGDKWAAKIPATGGEVKTLTVSFEDPAAWTALFGPVPHTLDQARAKARGLVFVGNKPAKFAVTSLLIDGYEPPCD